MAPAASRRCTTGAVRAATYANDGHAAVVCIPSTSMLSFTANGTPASGRAGSTRGRARECLPPGRQGDPDGRTSLRLDACEHAIDDVAGGLPARRVVAAEASNRQHALTFPESPEPPRPEGARRSIGQAPPRISRSPRRLPPHRRSSGRAPDSARCRYARRASGQGT